MRIKPNDKVKILKYKEYLSSGPYLELELKMAEGKIGTIIKGPKQDSFQVDVDNSLMWVPDCMLELQG